jgi:release factor glutamine methyltransferase
MDAAFSRDQTIDAARRVLAARLDAAGIDAAATEARLLIGHVTGLSPAGLIAQARAPLGAAAERLTSLAQRRLGGEPVARLLGAWEFHGLPFALAPATLIPRPDTERLVDLALGRLGDRPALIADIGTGSGAILVAALHGARSARGIGVDLSVEALATARDNARANGVADRAHFVAGDLAAALATGGFDLVLSNPPYIASAVIETLSIEVRAHDPRLALDGGPDGLACYRRLIPEAFRALKSGGWCALEIGFDQGAAVRGLMAAAGFEAVAVALDFGGRDRVVGGVRP